MEKIRVIARLDIKNEFVIKGIQLEGLRKIGSPLKLATKYYEQGIDEIILLDAVASLYGRNSLFEIIKSTCKEVFIPITVGGGIRTIEDIDMALHSGADKIAINSAALKNPAFIKEASQMYGSQCIVGSIEAKKKGNAYEAYIDNGREETGIDAIEWSKKLVELGVGEILVTSIDNDGTKKGYDNELIGKIMDVTTIPIIASGGAGKAEHFTECYNSSKVDALATGAFLHYEIGNINEIKKSLLKNNINVRYE